MQFHSPIFLLLLPLIPGWAFYQMKKKRGPGLLFSSGALLGGLRGTFKSRMAQNLIFVRGLALACIVLALARPRSPIEESKIRTEGIDIVLAVDCSSSMLAEDFKLGTRRMNRLEVVKDVVRDFVQGRHNDRIGIVAFAARAYTVCPLTLDYGWLKQNLERVEIGMIEDGTAIGSGIASSLNRLKATELNLARGDATGGLKGKVIILLTDGRNNAGRISPLTAADAAAALKVKIYTIGAGTKGLAPYPVKDFFGNTVYQSVQIDIDEDTLTKIANSTGARYFRAQDTEGLREIYKEIDRLEKSVVEEKGYMEHRELFPIFLIPGIILLFSEAVLGNTFLRRIP